MTETPYGLLLYLPYPLACKSELLAYFLKGHLLSADSEEVLTNWAEIKKQEKAGKEWTEEYLPEAFDESIELIRAAKKRKGIG